MPVRKERESNPGTGAGARLPWDLTSASWWALARWRDRCSDERDLGEVTSEEFPGERLIGAAPPVAGRRAVHADGEHDADRRAGGNTLRR